MNMMFIFINFVFMIYVLHVKRPCNNTIHHMIRERSSVKRDNIQEPSPALCKIQQQRNDTCGMFVRVGHIYKDDAIQPLFGKQIGRDIWKYYILLGNNDNGHFPIAVINKHRNCLDHNGCNQLTDHDIVKIENSEIEYNIKLYKNTFN